MQLSKKILKDIQPADGLVLPDEKLLAFPEKVLQFGTGVLLRGLPDYFIDKANRQGIFNGRIVVVKSTASGGTDAFESQDGLFTLCVRGIENGREKQETIVNSSVSRVLNAATAWKDILACAANPDMQLIISNTTEVGIVLTDDDMHAAPPASFPGKLLAFLYERYRVFKGAANSGMVIVPTELIVNNGDKLRDIVLEQARRHDLETSFIDWLEQSNYFCNSLVDRIVPGKLSPSDQEATTRQLGYTDDLMIMAETFRLWAIEASDDRVHEILSFAAADEGVIIAPDIEKFRELKLRLLNGTHTFSCGLAFLAGFTTVKQAMTDEQMGVFVHNLMVQEMARAVSNETISYSEACEFSARLLDRFRNPFLEHQWIAITLNYTSKMKMRNIPVLLRHYSNTDKVPAHMALGFAAYLLFMNGKAVADNRFEGTLNGVNYPIQDDQAAYFAAKWEQAGNDATALVESVLSDKEQWGTDLTQLPGFAQAVTNELKSLQQQGAVETLRNAVLQKI